MTKHIIIASLWLSSITSGLLAQGPAVCYPFDNGVTHDIVAGLRSSPGSFSAMAGRDGRANGAISFNCNQALSLGSDSLLKPQVGTISLWASVDTTCADGDASHSLIQTYGYNMKISYAFTYNRFSSAISGGAGFATNTNLQEDMYNSDGRWEHFCTTWGMDSIRIYVNGVQKASGPRTAQSVYYDPPANVWVGYRPVGMNGPPSYFGGGIDDLQLYRRALSAAEVMALYQAPSGCVLSSVDEVSEEGAEGKPTLYPNPTDGSVWAGHHAGLSFTSYQVYDIAGREVLQQAVSDSQVRFDMTGMARGIYLVLLTDERGRVSQHKLVLE